MLQINDTAPDFTAETTEGVIKFHDYIDGGWAMFVSHPKDFTPVCTTELGSMAKLKPEFDKRGVKMIGISVDPVTDHKKWKGDIEKVSGAAVTYPMIGDPELKIAKLYGMLPATAGDKSDGRTPQDNATVRNVFIIGPDKKIKLILVYPMSAGRNFFEILRVIDSLQLTAKEQLSTPANWNPGDDAIIMGSVSDADAKVRFPAGWATPTPYIRLVKTNKN
ncbi:MAG: peroxiredoxin [Hydrotalea sp.]|nr:peroxiredoxin [Hydrotalea sp.]